jgi:hypothetical protein
MLIGVDAMFGSRPSSSYCAGPAVALPNPVAPDAAIAALYRGAVWLCEGAFQVRLDG